MLSVSHKLKARFKKLGGSGPKRFYLAWVDADFFCFSNNL